MLCLLSLGTVCNSEGSAFPKKDWQHSHLSIQAQPSDTPNLRITHDITALHSVLSQSYIYSWVVL